MTERLKGWTGRIFWSASTIEYLKTIWDHSSFSRWFVLYFSFLFLYLSEKLSWLGRKEKVSKYVIAVVFKLQISSMTFFQSITRLSSTREQSGQWAITTIQASKHANSYFTRFLHPSSCFFQLWWHIHYMKLKVNSCFFPHCLYFKVTGYFHLGVSHVQVMQRVPVKLKIPQTLY